MNPFIEAIPVPNSLTDKESVQMTLDQELLSEMIKFISKGSADLPLDNDYLVDCCCAHNYIEITKKLLKEPAFRGIAGRSPVARMSPLDIACRHGQTEIVEMLLKDPRVDPGANEQSALRCACCNSRIDIIKLLLEDDRVNPSVGESNIKRTVENRNAEVLTVLLDDQREDIRKDDYANVRSAFCKGYMEVVGLLCQDERMNKMIGVRLALKCNQIEVAEYVMWRMYREIFLVLAMVIKKRDVAGVIWTCVIDLHFADAR